MKRNILFCLCGVLLLSMACSFGAPAATPAPPTVAPTPLIVVVTPTRSPHAPEEANAGSHLYWMSPYENGCTASDDSKYPQFREKEHVFAPDFSTVTYGGRTYPRVGEHRYQSINQDDKPLMLTFSPYGFVLNVYSPGESPDTNDPCLIFSFTLQE